MQLSVMNLKTNILKKMELWLLLWEKKRKINQSNFIQVWECPKVCVNLQTDVR